jgi:hypothetical protein
MSLFTWHDASPEGLQRLAAVAEVKLDPQWSHEDVRQYLANVWAEAPEALRAKWTVEANLLRINYHEQKLAAMSDLLDEWGTSNPTPLDEAAAAVIPERYAGCRPLSSEDKKKLLAKYHLIPKPPVIAGFQGSEKVFGHRKDLFWMADKALPTLQHEITPLYRLLGNMVQAYSQGEELTGHFLDMSALLDSLVGHVVHTQFACLDRVLNTSFSTEKKRDSLLDEIDIARVQKESSRCKTLLSLVPQGRRNDENKQPKPKPRAGGSSKPGADGTRIPKQPKNSNRKGQPPTSGVAGDQETKTPSN